MCKVSDKWLCIAYAVTAIILTRQSIDCMIHIILNEQCYMLASMCILMLPGMIYIYMNDSVWQKYVILMWWYDWHDIHMKGSHSRIIWCMFILPAMCLISSLSYELTSPQLCCQFKIQVAKTHTQLHRLTPTPLVLSTFCTFCRLSVRHKSYLRVMYFNLIYRGFETVYAYSNEYDLDVYDSTPEKR